MFDWFRTRALSTVLGLTVLAGAACGPPALYLTLTAEDETGQTQLGHPDSRAGVAGDFASLFVAAWLRGDDLRFFNPLLSSEESGLLVDRVAAVRTVERGRGLFDVVVAADVVEFVSGSEEQFRPVDLRFYAVGVGAEDDGNMVVLGPPGVVAAPDVADTLPTAVTDVRRATAPDMAPLAETLDGFFAAYLTGSGDVRLFSSPESILTAVAPPAFGRTEIFELGWGPVPGIDDPSIRLTRVTVDAHSPSGQQRLEYSIVMAERDGRWEVSQVLHAPVVLTKGDAE
ncbi:MAG: hypothetical protein ACR2QK_06200 [Acidimicrobiales bacterium]